MKKSSKIAMSFALVTCIFQMEASIAYGDKLVGLTKEETIKNISSKSAYKIHLGMHLFELMDTYPNSDFKLESGGEDIYGDNWDFSSIDITEIRKVKLGLQRGGSKAFGGTIDVKGEDRFVQFSLTYDGLISSFMVSEHYGQALDCKSILGKLVKKYGDDYKSTNGAGEKSRIDAEIERENKLRAVWNDAGKKLVHQINPQVNRKFTAYDINVFVNCDPTSNQGSYSMFKFNSAALKKFAEVEFENEVNRREEALKLKLKNQSVTPDF